MTNKKKKPHIPAQRIDTARHEIISAISDAALSVKEISSTVGISEKDVYAHLEHIKRTLHAEGMSLIVRPSECRKCGFVFKKRERFTKPGKCPQCKGTSIEEPLFRVDG
ncbi:MAG: transcriptional regulator [Thermodesulfobacteriota bacterium]